MFSNQTDLEALVVTVVKQRLATEQTGLQAILHWPAIPCYLFRALTGCYLYILPSIRTKPGRQTSLQKDPKIQGNQKRDFAGHTIGQLGGK